LNLVQQGFEVPFGYEEAIGFMFGSRIRDKDGVAATVIIGPIIVGDIYPGLGVVCGAGRLAPEQGKDCAILP
jgi:hypothetical protein